MVIEELKGGTHEDFNKTLNSIFCFAVIQRPHFMTSDELGFI